MMSSTLMSVGVVLLATTAGAFVQAPVRCVMTQQQQQQPTAGRTSSRSSLWPQHHRRPTRSLVSSTRLFSEGEDSGPVASAAEAAAPAAESSGEAGVEAGAAAVVEEEKPMSEAEMAQKAKMAEIERLRAKEKFITVKTGDFECLQCSFVYKPDNAGQGALQGTQFEDLPSSWVCPVCKAPKDTFVAQTKTIAGFEDNANYGFGANQMTGSQKNLLIFGSLAAFFALFLAGYALE